MSAVVNGTGGGAVVNGSGGGLPSDPLTVSHGGTGATTASDARTNLGVTVGPAIGTGTYAARPASPAVGDWYAVTLGVRKGSVYRCDVASSWTLVRIDYPGTVRPLYRYDSERLEGRTTVGAWVDEENGNTLAPAGNRTAAVTVSTHSASGLPQATWGASSAPLRAANPGPLMARARSVLVMAHSSIATNAAMIGWGGTGSNAGMWITTATNLAIWWGGAVTTAGSVAVPTNTTPRAFLLTYDGTTAAISLCAIAASPSWSTSGSGAITPATAGILAATYVPSLIVGADDSATFATDPWQGVALWIGVYDVALDSTQRDAIVAALATRYGL